MRTFSSNVVWLFVLGSCWCGQCLCPAAQLSGTRITNRGLQGVGRVEASSLDQMGETFGSVSALAIRDWRRTESGYSGTFVTLPDRGFNMDGFFSDYAARLHSLSFSFLPRTNRTELASAPKMPDNGLQDQIRVQYRSSSRFEFADRRGVTGLDPGTHSISLFGADLPYVVTQHLNGATLPVQRVAVDAEGLALKPDGSGWFSDEYGPSIYHFDRELHVDGIIVPPVDYRPMAATGSLSFTSTNDPVRGRRMNQGFEALGLNSASTRLFALLQSALIQDSGPTLESRRYSRLLVYDVSGPNAPAALVGEYVLPLPIIDETGKGSKPNKTASQSELVVLSDTEFMVLCRDSSGLGSGTTNPPVFKRVILADIKDATNLAALSSPRRTNSVAPGGKLLQGINPVSWVEVVDLLSPVDLKRFGFNTSFSSPNRQTFSEKWEGMALVSALEPDKPNDYFLFVTNDNDFMTARGRMRQADGLIHNYDAIGTNVLRGEHDTVFLAYRLTIESDARGAQKFP